MVLLGHGLVSQDTCMVHGTQVWCMGLLGHGLVSQDAGMVQSGRVHGAVRTVRTWVG